MKNKIRKKNQNKLTYHRSKKTITLVKNNFGNEIYETHQGNLIHICPLAVPTSVTTKTHKYGTDEYLLKDIDVKNTKVQNGF